MVQACTFTLGQCTNPRKLHWYLIILFLISRHVIVHITACALYSQDAISDGWDHVKLLDY